LAFHPGYGFIVGPFGFLTGSKLHLAALIINAMVAGGAVILTAALCRCLGGTRRLQNVAAIVAVLHPSLTAASRIGWPETALVVVLLAVALLADKAQWLAAGVAAGLAVSLHPRAIVIVVGVLLAASLQKKIFTAVSGVAIGFVPTCAMIWVTDAWPSDRLEAATNLGDGVSPLATIAGQWLVLGAGTGGLALLGICSVWWNHQIRRASASVTIIASSAVGMLILGGWVLAGSDRIDTLMYSRYIGPWAVPLTVLGLVTVNRKALGWWPISMVAALTGTSLWLSLSERSETTELPRRIMTLDVGVLWESLDQKLVIVGLVALAIVVVGITGSRYSVWVPLLLLFLVAVPSTVLNHQHLHKVGQIADGQATSAQLVPTSVSCLSHDQSVKSYAIWLYKLELPQIEHHRIDLSQGQLPCDRYVIADTSFVDTCFGATLVHKEPRASWGLVVYPAQGCG
jgi:hypothetical protein